MIPIWQNTLYTYNSTGLSYYVECNNIKLFSGKAIPFPGASSGQININKICENYLTQDLTILTSSTSSGSETHSDAAKTFNLRSTSTDNILYTYTFYYDWSYETLSSNLSVPVNGKYVDGMYKLQTTVTSNSVITYYDKTLTGTLGYYTLSCGEYVLYYLNRNGGWDSLLIEGKVKESDDFKVDKYETIYDMSLYYSRESHRFRNEITHNWELHTGWLSDRESAVLAKHLLPSNQVYLHNLISGKVYPVEITDNSVEYKKFKNENKLVSYTINVKDSNKKVIL